MLAPAGARCVCQERLSQLAGTAGTVPPPPQKSPPTRWEPLAVGSRRCRRDQGSAKRKHNPGGGTRVPSRRCHRCQCRGGTDSKARPVSRATPGARGRAGLVLRCPRSQGKGSRGRTGGRHGLAGEGPGLGRGVGQPELGQGSVSGSGQPWRGVEHSFAPAVVAVAGNKPARGFGINYSFSKGTGRTFLYRYMIIKLWAVTVLVTQNARILTYLVSCRFQGFPLLNSRSCCGRCCPACTGSFCDTRAVPARGILVPAGLHCAGLGQRGVAGNREVSTSTQLCLGLHAPFTS